MQYKTVEEYDNAQDYDNMTEQQQAKALMSPIRKALIFNNSFAANGQDQLNYVGSGATWKGSVSGQKIHNQGYSKKISSTPMTGQSVAGLADNGGTGS